MGNGIAWETIHFKQEIKLVAHSNLNASCGGTQETRKTTIYPPMLLKMHHKQQHAGMILIKTLS